MSARGQYLGRGNIYRLASGDIEPDLDSIRLSGSDEAPDFGGRRDEDDDDDDFGDDVGDFDGDFDGDETGDDVGDDLGDYVAGVVGDVLGDVLGEDLGDEVGRKRRRHKGRRRGPLRRRRSKKTMKWGKTIVSGTKTLAAGETGVVPMVLQHHFKATDVTFTAPTDALVQSISMGDRIIWNSPVPASVFATTSFLRNILDGQKLRAGLSIQATVSSVTGGVVTAMVFGVKPVNAVC